MIAQCQGGWCRVREKCAHYWAKKVDNTDPADRLCGAIERPLEMDARDTLRRKFPHLRRWQDTQTGEYA